MFGRNKLIGFFVLVSFALAACDTPLPSAAPTPAPDPTLQVIVNSTSTPLCQTFRALEDLELANCKVRILTVRNNGDLGFGESDTEILLNVHLISSDLRQRSAVVSYANGLTQTLRSGMVITKDNMSFAYIAAITYGAVVYLVPENGMGWQIGGENTSPIVQIYLTKASEVHHQAVGYVRSISLGKCEPRIDMAILLDITETKLHYFWLGDESEQLCQ